MSTNSSRRKTFPTWPEFYQEARTLSNLAEHFRQNQCLAESERALMSMNEVLLQAVLTTRVPVCLPVDDASSFRVGSHPMTLQMSRSTTAPFPKMEQCFVNAIVATGRLTDKLIGSSARMADFGDVFDQLDRVSGYDLGKIEIRLANAFSLWASREFGAARYECKLAFEALKAVMRSSGSIVPTPQQVGVVRKRVCEARAECEEGFLSLPTLKSLWRSIDRLPFRSKRILPSQQSVRIAARLARQVKDFGAAKQQLSEVERDLFDGPFGGPGYVVSPAGPLPKPPSAATARCLCKR